MRILASVIMTMSMIVQARADWTRTGNTITDANGWVLKVEAKTINGVSGLSLPTDAVVTKGTPTGVLNLSGAISDESVIIGLNDYALRSSSAGTLYSVTLPDTVIRIGGYLFNGQSSLTNVVPLLPASVKIVGDRPFYQVPVRGALDLTSVTNMTGGSNFRSTKITSLVLGPGLQSIPAFAFESDTTLGSVTFADGLQIIGDHAFSSCTSLTNIVNALPHTVTSLGSGQVVTFGSVPYTGRVELVNAAFANLPTQFWTTDKVADFVFGIGLANVEDYAFDYVGNNSRAWDIHCRGSVPTFRGAKSSVFRNTSDWKLRVFYPFYDDATGGWREWVAANTTPLTSAQTNTYVAAYPDAPLPVGYGKAGTIFANEYLVPWSPPVLSTNALHVVGSVTRNVVGAGEPALGEVVPAYGVVENVADGSTIACSAPATGVSGGLGYACAGYVLETLGASGWENPVTNLASTSFTYTQSGSAAARVTWLWEFSGWMLTCAYDTIKGTVAASPAPNGAAGSYLPGTEVTLTCTPSAGCTFVGWVGDTEGVEGLDSATLTFTVDKARKIYPKIKGFWQMANSGNTLISDGEWTFNCADYATSPKRLRITGVSTRSPYGSVDFAQPIKDMNGTLIETARITKIGDGSYGSFFSGDTTLYAVELDSATTAFGHYVFQSCSNLRTVTPFLPPTISSMGSGVFDNCGKLVGKLYLPCNPGQNDFRNLPGLYEIEIAEGVTTVDGDSAFQGCANVQKVTLPSTLATLGNIRIGGSPTFEPAFPPSLKSISSDAFKYAYIANGDIRLVPPKANGPITGWSGERMLGGPNYSGNPNVTNVTLWTTALSPRLFQNWSALRTVHLVGDRPSFGYSLFAGVPAYRVRIFVPLGNATWNAAIANNFSGIANVTACADLSAADLAAYRDAYPGERRPKKVITFNSSNKQYLLLDGDPGTVLLIR